MFTIPQGHQYSEQQRIETYSLYSDVFLDKIWISVFTSVFSILIKVMLLRPNLNIFDLLGAHMMFAEVPALSLRTTDLA